jgi:hypothetical protein
MLIRRENLIVPGPEVGSLFTRLLVIEDNEDTTSGKRKVVCRCSCGAIRRVQLKDLLRGATKSCALAALSKFLARGGS